MTVKRSMTIRGHRTSISVEDAFWDRLQVIARAEDCALASLVASIDARRKADTNLSSAIRLFVLEDALLAKSARPGPDPVEIDAPLREDASPARGR